MREELNFKSMSYKAIQVENLSKCYRIGSKKRIHKTLGSAVGSWVKSPAANLQRLRSLTRFAGDAKEEDVIWAVKDVSFEVQDGQVVGIIGRNGAGKSTLLKIVSRITEPTRGRVVLLGRVSSLLEVGTGFHPELTGRENVYLNGAILGMSRQEIKKKFDEIVAFAEVNKFIDTPVKHYSSGMKVRLAFSVAAHLEPEILIVDEVLAVGDSAFQKKCLGKMGDVAKQGRTVLFVSHTMGAIRSLCERTILMQDGMKIMDGESGEVIDHYLRTTTGENTSIWRNPELPSKGEEFILYEIKVQDRSGAVKDFYSESEDVFVSIRYALFRTLSGMRVKLRLMTEQGVLILTTSDIPGTTESRGPGGYISTCCIPAGILNTGLYTVVLFAAIPRFRELLPQRDYVRFAIERTTSKGSTVQEKLHGVLNPYLVRWSVSELALQLEHE